MADEKVNTTESGTETSVPNAEALASGEGIVDTTKQTTTQEPVKNTGGAEGIQPVVEFTQSSFWDKAKEQLGDKFVVPEGLTAENEYEMYAKAMTDFDGGTTEKITDTGPVDDDFIQSYRQESAKDDFDRAKWLQEKNQSANMKNLPDKDFLKAHYLKKDGVKSDDNPRGWDNEELDAYVDNIQDGEAKRMANDIRSSMDVSETTATKDFEMKQKKLYDEQIVVRNDRRDKEMTELFGEVEKMSDIYGLEIGKADFDDLKPKFKEWVTPKEDKPSQAYQHFFTDDKKQSLQSNVDLFKYFVLKARGDNAFAEALTSVKESVKKDVLNKTDLNQKTQGGGTKHEHVVDVTALGRPDTGK